MPASFVVQVVLWDYVSIGAYCQTVNCESPVRELVLLPESTRAARAWYTLSLYTILPRSEVCMSAACRGARTSPYAAQYYAYSLIAPLFSSIFDFNNLRTTFLRE